MWGMFTGRKTRRSLSLDSSVIGLTARRVLEQGIMSILVCGGYIYGAFRGIECDATHRGVGEFMLCIDKACCNAIFLLRRMESDDVPAQEGLRETSCSAITI